MEVHLLFLFLGLEYLGFHLFPVALRHKLLRIFKGTFEYWNDCGGFVSMVEETSKEDSNPFQDVALVRAEAQNVEAFAIGVPVCAS